MTPSGEKTPGPSKDLTPLAKAVSDVTATVLWGMEGTGKTIMVLRYWPLPILVLNLDRPLTTSHLGYLDDERIGQIYVKNLRETLTDVDHREALRIKTAVQSKIEENLEWLRGGTVLLDGGTLWRSVLKLADENISNKAAEGKRMNPKDKEFVNAYQATLISHITDQGLNLAITAHAAWKWVFTDDGSGKKSLEKTTGVYPKLDDVAFERCTNSLLLLKRCTCGRNIVNEDGSCTQASIDKALGKKADHSGRAHVARIVTNKFNTATEGSEWPNLNYKTLQILCFDREKAKALVEVNRGE